MSPRRAAWHPRESEELLLHAALDQDESALDSWRRWSADTPPTRIETTAFQVLPLVSYNLSRISPGDPDLELIKGVRRHAWTHNQQLIRLGEAVVTELSEAGIDTLMLKGLSLATLYYPDVGARPMVDLDLLVPRRSALDAIAVLSQKLDPGTERPMELVEVQHGMPLTDPAGREVDLHWYSIWRSAPDDDFWQAAVPVELGEAPTKALSPPDMLLQVCAHGATWHRTPMIRWIADAVMVLRARPDLDWDRFVTQARKRQLTRTLSGALEHLRAAFDAPVPGDVLRALRESNQSLRERLTTRAADRPQTMLRSLCLQWDRYRRLKVLDPTAPRPTSFPAHLKSAWGCETYGEFAVYTLRRAAGRARGGNDVEVKREAPLQAESVPPQR